MADTNSDPFSAPHVDPPAVPSYQALTGLAVGVVIVAALYFGKDILLPVTLAVMLSFVLSPLVQVLRGLRIPRVVAVVFSVGLALSTIGGVGVLVGTQLVQVAGDLPQYQTTIEQKVSAVQSVTLGRITELTSRLAGWLGRPGQIASSPAPASPVGGPAAASEQKPVPVEVRQPPINPLALARRIFDASASSAGNRSHHLHCRYLHPNATR